MLFQFLYYLFWKTWSTSHFVLPGHCQQANQPVELCSCLQRSTCFFFFFFQGKSNQLWAFKSECSVGHLGIIIEMCIVYKAYEFSVNCILSAGTERQIESFIYMLLKDGLCS